MYNQKRHPVFDALNPFARRTHTSLSTCIESSCILLSDTDTDDGSDTDGSDADISSADGSDTSVTDTNSLSSTETSIPECAEYCMNELCGSFPKMGAYSQIQIIDDCGQFSLIRENETIQYWANRFQTSVITGDTHQLMFDNKGTGDQGVYLDVAGYIPTFPQDTQDGNGDRYRDKNKDKNKTVPMHMFYMSTNDGSTPSTMIGCADQDTEQFFFCDFERGNVFAVTNGLVVNPHHQRHSLMIPVLPSFGCSANTIAAYLTSVLQMLTDETL